MTLDKIKYYMEEHIFAYWTETFFELTNGDYLKQKQLIDRAINMIQTDIDLGVRNDISRIAELHLLRHLRG